MDLNKMLEDIEKKIYALNNENNKTNNLIDESDNKVNELYTESNTPSLNTELRNMLDKYMITGDIEILESYVLEITYGANIDKEQALLEKVNGRPVLAEIIKHGIFMSSILSRTILHNEELMNVIFEEKYDNILWGLSEDDFLIKLGDMTILEHLVKNEMFKSYWVKEIKNSDVILDIILKYNLKDCFPELHENQLFKVYKGKLVIEFMFEHNLVDFTTVSNIKNHPEIYNFIIKYKRQDLLDSISEELLTQKINEKYIFDLIIENGANPNVDLLKTEELINLIIERKRYDLLSNLSTDKLMKPHMEYASMFEFLLVNGIIPEGGINEIEYEKDNMMFFYNIIEKHDKFDCLKDVQENVLLINFNGRETLLETLLSKGIKPTISSYESEKTFDLLYSLNQFEELQKCSSKLQKKHLPNDKTLCEELLDRNLDPGSQRNDDIEITKMIFEHKRYDLYTKLDVRQLFMLSSLNETFLDVLLEEAKTNDKINVSEIANGYHDSTIKPKIYIAFAKHDMQMYLKTLDKEDLLEDNLLKSLMELDKDLTVNKILSSKVKEDFDIAMMLRFYGVSQDEIKFKSVTKAVEEEYLQSNIEEYEKIELTEEQEYLLSNLQNVMNDGKSDPKILRAFIASYRHLLAANSPHAYEIYHILNIKQNDSRFAYKRIDDGAYFSPYEGWVSMDDTNIDTLNHETGHALFEHLTNGEIPAEFNTTIDKLRTSESCLERTAEYSKRFYELLGEVTVQVERDYMPGYDESITEEKKEEIKKYLDTLISEQKQIYLQKGYSEETLDLIFARTFTLEEYLKQDRRVKKEEMIDLILRTKHGTFLAIGDYLDGIHVGRLKGELLKDKEGKTIKKTYGHGIHYYSRGNEWAFNEMLANYSAISKSDNPQEGLDTLKQYIGEELFNIIQNYYYKEILQSKKYITEKTKTM